jgi:hypothetical protein
MKAFAMAVLIVLAGHVSKTQAGHHYCRHCGCQQHCKKVCRLICGTKKEVKPVYCCECEDFCVPGPSVRCGVQCECNRLGIKCCHAVYKPTCAEVRTKKVLVKKEIEKEVPAYKWVVEEVCCQCGQAVQEGEPSPPNATPAMAAWSTSARGDYVVEDDAFAGEIEQVSAEEEVTRLPTVDENDLVGNEQALVSDTYEPAREPPKRKGLIHALFGK